MQPRRTLNVRFAAILIVTLAVVGGAVHLLHGAQVHRNSEALFKRAQVALDANEWGAAAGYLSRYLGFVPNDVEALVQLGQALRETATQPREKLRIFFVLDKALRLDPDRSEIRRLVAEIAMDDIGRYSDAEFHLKYLLEKSPGDPELEQRLARCYEASAKYAEAEELYLKAIEHDSTQIDSYLRVAFLQRQHLTRATDKADALIDEMVAKNSDSFAAYLARVTYRKQFGSLALDSTLQAISSDVAKAQELSADELEVLLAAADLRGIRAVLAEAGRDLEIVASEIDEARQLLMRSIERYPDRVEPYQAMVTLERRWGKSDDALELLQRGLDAIKDKAKTPQVAALKWTLADLLIDRGAVDEAEQEIVALRKSGNVYPALLEYLDAKIKLRENLWQQTVNKLEGIRPLLSRRPDLAVETDLLLGQCYRNLLDRDRQLASFRRAVLGDPLSVKARLSVAQTLLEQGKVADALMEYRQMRGPGVSAMVARLVVFQNLRLPEAKRNWREIEDAIQKARDENPKLVEPVILHALTLAERNGTKHAEQFLEGERQRWSGDSLWWTTMADFAARQGDLQRAITILDEANDRLKDLVEFRIERARALALHSDEPSRDALLRLAQELNDYSVDDRVRLLTSLADIHRRLGNDKEALRLWTTAAELQPFELNARLVWFDLAIQCKDEAAIDRALVEIQRVEGSGGSLAPYGEAVKLLWKAASREEPGELGGIRDLVAKVAARRPTWSNVARLEGELRELERNRPAAIDCYHRALAWGERSPQVLSRLILLLHQERRFTEADQLIRAFEEQSLLSDDMKLLAFDVAFRTKDLDRALVFARQAVSSSLDSYQNHLLLGQVLAELSRREKSDGRADESGKYLREAEQSLRKAVELGETNAQVWVALVQFLAGSGQRQSAQEAIELAAQKIATDQKHLALASCYEITGQKERAEESYVAAMKASSPDPRAARQLADFYLRNAQVPKAETELRRMVDGEASASDDDVRWARRTLAELLAAQRGSNLTQAFELIDQNLQENAGSVEDARAKAYLLARQTSRRLRRGAIGLLESIVQRRQATPTDQFVLAQLYENDGDWTRARGHMRNLLASQVRNPVHVAKYARSLIRRGEAAEAQSWVRALQELSPDSFLAMSTRARWLGAQGNGAEAAQLVSSYVDKTRSNSDSDSFSKIRELVVEGKVDQAAQLLDALESDDSIPAATLRQARDLLSQGKSDDLLLLLRAISQNREWQATRIKLAASLLDELGQFDAAEKLFHAYIEASQLPTARLALVQCLARQGKMKEALDQCELAWKSCPPELAAPATVAALRAGPSDEQHWQRVETWLLAAIDKHPLIPALRLSLADLRDLQRRFDESPVIYRTVLSQDNRNIPAMNNLAWLLAHKGGRGGSEALLLINRAIEIAGPAPELLDTRASVYLALGEPGPAITDLEDALDRTATGTPEMAIRQFHLAAAYEAAARLPDARDALQSAQASALTANSLHPLERKEYERLVRDLQ